MVMRSIAVIATFGVGVALFGSSAFAVNSGDITFSAELLPSTTVTIPTNPVGVNITPSSAGAFGSTSFNVTVSTNQTGYTLSMTTSSTSLASTTINPETNEYFTIPTLDFVSGGYTESNFTRNRWGISIDGGNYNAIAASQQLKDTDVATNADVTTIGVGANLDLLTASGSYSTTIEFAVVPKITCLSTLSGNMQDIAAASSYCDGASGTMTDSRDGKTYTVAKIGDTIWMTKNLNIAGGTTLTPVTSNVTSNYTLPASSTAGFDDDTKAYVYNDSTYGGYYSWIAATVGANLDSGNATSDICPKGWRLPTSDEYEALKSTYTTGATLTVSPWYGAYGGYYDDGSANDVGSGGSYWSSTAYNSIFAYVLSFYSSGANVADTYKDDGSSVRCIVK